MTKVEKKQIEEIWSRLIHLIGVMDPGFDAVSFCRSKIGAKNLNGVLNGLDYLQIGLKYLKLDTEASNREKDFLLKIIHGGG